MNLSPERTATRPSEGRHVAGLVEVIEAEGDMVVGFERALIASDNVPVRRHVPLGWLEVPVE